MGVSSEASICAWLFCQAGIVHHAKITELNRRVTMSGLGQFLPTGSGQMIDM